MTSIDISKYKDLYIRTAHDYIAKLSQGISVLTIEKNNAVLVDELHIAAHSLKGQSLAMGYTATGNVSLTLEHIFSNAKTHPEILPSLQPLIKKAIEALKTSVESIEKDGHEQNISTIIDDIKRAYPAA